MDGVNSATNAYYARIQQLTSEGSASAENPAGDETKIREALGLVEHLDISSLKDDAYVLIGQAFLSLSRYACSLEHKRLDPQRMRLMIDEVTVCVQRITDLAKGTTLLHQIGIC